MSRTIYKVKIPGNLQETINTSMKKVRQIHRKHMLRNSIIAVGCIVLGMGCFAGWGYNNPVLASQIPFVGRLFQDYGSKVTFSGQFDSAREISTSEETDHSDEKLTASAQGLQITAKESYCDGESLYIGVHMVKEDGFGTIEYYPLPDENGEQTQQINAQALISINGQQITPSSRIDLDINIEGKQLSDTEFEGLLKIDLLDHGIEIQNGDEVSLDFYGFLYINKDLVEAAGQDFDAHLLRDENGELVLDENGCTVLDLKPGEKLISARIDLYDNWILRFPVSVDTGTVRKMKINEGNEYFTVDSITITPYEIKLETEIPQSEMGYDYSLFDQDGNKLFWEETYWIDEDWNHTVRVYPVREKTISELHLYYDAEYDTGTVYEMTEEECQSSCTYQTVLDVQ